MSDLAWFYYCETCKRYGWELKGIYRQQQSQPTKCPDCRDRLDLESAQTLANAILEHGLGAIGKPLAPLRAPPNNQATTADQGR